MRMRDLIEPEFDEALLEAVAELEEEPVRPTYGTGDPLAGLTPGEVPLPEGPSRHRLLRYLRQEILPTAFPRRGSEKA